MKVGEFIDVSKRMVKEYVNRYVIQNEIEKITKNEIVVINFSNDIDSYEILLTTMGFGDLSYSVRYDKKEDKLYSDLIFLKINKNSTNLSNLGKTNSPT